MVWNWKQTFCLSMLVALWQPGQVRMGLLLVGMIERGAGSLLYLFHLQVKHKLPCLTSYKFYGSETPESRKREKKMLSIKFWYFYHTWSQHLPPLFCIHHSVGENSPISALPIPIPALAYGRVLRCQKMSSTVHAEVSPPQKGTCGSNGQAANTVPKIMTQLLWGEKGTEDTTLIV